jgi:uncharacterized membrane protein
LKYNILFLGIVILLLSCNNNPSNPIVAENISFSQVKTIISKNCTSTCHAPSKEFYSGLPVVLESDSDIVAKAESIKNAISGPFTITNKKMPPETNLTNQEISILIQWYKNGAKTSN